MTIPQTAPARSLSISQILLWVVSVVVFAVGIILVFVGTSSQAGVETSYQTTGELDLSAYYLAGGLTTLGGALASGGFVGLALALAVTALRARRPEAVPAAPVAPVYEYREEEPFDAADQVVPAPDPADVAAPATETQPRA